MAEDRDDAQKTELPTQKRLSEAEERGDVTQSPDIAAWLVLAVATGIISLWGGQIALGLRTMMVSFLAQPHTLTITTESAGGLLGGIGFKLLAVLALPFGLLLGVGVGAHWLQHPPVFSTERLKPDLSRLSLIKGVGKLFGRAAIVNLIKGVLKTGFVAVAIWLALAPVKDQFLAVITLPIAQLLPITQALMTRGLIAALAILAIIALADYGWQYFERMRRLKMTRQEVKEEFKQTEGDPAVKGRLKQIRAERSRKRMMAAVPKASVIITNPTHYAVALSYEKDKMGAPVVVAKGVDSLALKIREIGREAGVPIVENPPLARALYASVELDEAIKPEHYKAVAQVIGFVMRLKNKVAAKRK